MTRNWLKTIPSEPSPSIALPNSLSLTVSATSLAPPVESETTDLKTNCPIDLKEAISSVIFATPKCSYIPELTDVKKHMASKYGKEFVSAAVELHPDYGLVEKFSAKAPDGPTKIKILTAIAEEHNIKWESKLFGDNDTKASQDLLGPPNSGGPSQLTPTHDAYTNLYDQSANTTARKTSGNNSATSGMLDIEIKSSGASMMLAELALEAGLPESVLNVVHGTHVCHHPLFN
ncbi:hypothetical protein RYX36_031225 [Vicia faba]